MSQEHGVLVAVGEFGPFDVLSEWAHRACMDGRCELAVRRCREARLVVQAAGDVQTTRYLHYVEGMALQELGRHREAITCALDLLADVDGEEDPDWRAKGLALLAEASAGAGELSRALDALAEGLALVERGRPDRYGFLSASMAVAIAMRAVYLFEDSAALLVVPRPCTSPEVVLNFAYEAGVLQAYWAATLELIGRRMEAGPHLVRCAALALRMQRLATDMGDDEMLARAQVLEAFAVLRLGERTLAGARARAASGRFEHRRELLESQLLELVLGGELLSGQRWAEARERFQVAFAGARATKREVWTATAMYALADTDVGEFGRHPAVGMWKLMARRALQRMWDEREARFGALADRARLRELSEESRRIGAERLADPLTGLGNRRMMVDSVGQGTDQLSVVFIDVDRFKDVNDEYSHAVGDEVLLRIAQILRQHCRPEDTVIRYGGDEFVVLVHGDGGVAAATDIAHRLHAAVTETDWGEIAEHLSVTVSIGVARAEATAEALSGADAALLEAKRAGRNRVVAA